MRTIRRLLFALASATLAVACNDAVEPTRTPHVDMVDRCDSASFNAAIGAGTCVTGGAVTFAAFNAELGAEHTVASWRFDPAFLTVRVGDSIVAVNQGGETHTFTEVDAVGGGIVPALNSASGNTVVAPECQALDGDDFVPAGGRYTTEHTTVAGEEKYQCCIHPWMRTRVTVGSR